MSKHNHFKQYLMESFRITASNHINIQLSEGNGILVFKDEGCLLMEIFNMMSMVDNLSSCGFLWDLITYLMGKLILIIRQCWVS
ncbi:unnamed protein product [Rhizophagus irregularis]|nr:unnamed protein product [Rhizophagus irregularis]CAB5100093.1 unnamed protein product [Rhizophagus irregularis]